MGDMGQGVKENKTLVRRNEEKDNKGTGIQENKRRRLTLHLNS